jgi:hypothetical protein
MIISAKKFKDNQGNDFGVNIILDNGEQWSITLSEGNQFYQAYLKWLAEGNTPEPAEEQQ